MNWIGVREELFFKFGKVGLDPIIALSLPPGKSASDSDLEHHLHALSKK